MHPLSPGRKFPLSPCPSPWGAAIKTTQLPPRPVPGASPKPTPFLPAGSSRHDPARKCHGSPAEQRQPSSPPGLSLLKAL